MSTFSTLQALYTLILDDPSRLVQVHCHSRERMPFTIETHQHDNLLQMDLLEGVQGMLRLGDHELLIASTVAVTCYPGVVHGFTLLPRQHVTARVFSVKLLVPPTLPLVTEHVLAPISTTFASVGALKETMECLERLVAMQHPNTLRIVALVGEMLSLWPLSTERAPADIVTWPELLRDDNDPINTAINCIERQLPLQIELNVLADEVGLSKRHLCRRFAEVVGMSPHAYANCRRLRLAQEMLAEHRHSITQVAQHIGFPSIHAFSRWFTRLTGTSPSEYRGQHQLL